MSFGKEKNLRAGSEEGCIFASLMLLLLLIEQGGGWLVVGGQEMGVGEGLATYELHEGGHEKGKRHEGRGRT